MQKAFLVLLLALTCRTSLSFSLIGELEAWQTTALGYNVPGRVDIGGPKNLGEEYRWNQPVITYGFDKSFTDYFGSNGVAAVDAAFAILNSLPAFSSLNLDLSEYPLQLPDGTTTTFRDARRRNPTASALRLIDLKSFTLSLLVEELGLAEPERFSWTLRNRTVDAGPPAFTNYHVIQRNFDPVTFEPTPYVNGTRYTYQVQEFANPDYADAVELSTDPEFSYTSIASATGNGLGLIDGVYFTYLTRDDIGGLRYIYHRDNENWEPFPAGTQILAADITGFQTISNFDLTLLSAQSFTNPPSVLTNLYPGLVVSSVFTNTTPLIRVQPVSTQVFVGIITNRDDLQIVTGADLYDFSQYTLTNPPSVVTNSPVYPGLQIRGFSQTITQRADIVSIVLTNGPKFPWGDPFATNFVFYTNYFTNLQILYHYTFANVLTNVFSPRTRVVRETFGLDKEPWSDPFNPTFRTNLVETLVTQPSGNIFILSSNTLRYEFTGIAATNLVGITNYFNETNFVANGLFRTIRDAEYRIFTNIQYAVYPIVALTQGFFTNIVFGTVTNQAQTYNYTFANVLTNYSTTVTVPVTVNVINPDGSTNTSTFNTNLVVGGFLIDTNGAGFNFTGLENVSLLPVTILLLDDFDAQGRRIQQIVTYTFTNTIYGILPFTLQPAPAVLLRPGIDKLRFVKVPGPVLPNGNFDVTNRFQATYRTNNVVVTSTFQLTSTLPDIVFVASDIDPVGGDLLGSLSGRSENFQNNAALNGIDPDQGGPGTINPTVTITFNKVGQGMLNQFPGFITEESVRGNSLFFDSGLTFFWGSFDGSTNPPIVYPEDITLEIIQSRILGSNP